MLENEENNENNGQNMPMNFDEANMAAAGIFEGESPGVATPPPSQEGGFGEENAGDGDPAEENDHTGAKGASPDDPQGMDRVPPQMQQPSQEMLLRQAFDEMQALKNENMQLRQAIGQQSEAQKQNIVEEAMQMPTLDLAGLVYDDENIIKAKQGQYAQDMAKYIQGVMMKEMSPFIEQAKDGLLQKQKSEVIAGLSALPDLQGISDMLPQLDSIMAKNKLFSGDNIPLDEKYIAAYLILNGINSKKNGEKEREITPDMFMELYNSKPEFRDLVDKQRLAEVQGAQGVPVMSPSTGAVNAALSIPQTPKNFDEAGEMTRKFFG